MIYRDLTPAHGHRLIDWAEAHNVDWDVWNAAESIFLNAPTMELGLAQWPDNWESI